MKRRPKSEFHRAVEAAAEVAGKRGRELLGAVERKERAELPFRALAFAVAFRGLGSRDAAREALAVLQRARMGKLFPTPTKRWKRESFEKAHLQAAHETAELQEAILRAWGFPDED